MGVETFTRVYSQLNSSNLESLKQIYHPDVVFIDPAHQVKGIDELLTYFTDLFSNINTCTFDIAETCKSDSQAFLTWTMTFSHPKMNHGRDVKVYGTSHVKFTDEKVIYHRDYFDLGQMIYEQLPVLGSVIRLVKKRVSA